MYGQKQRRGWLRDFSKLVLIFGGILMIADVIWDRVTGSNQYLSAIFRPKYTYTLSANQYYFYLFLVIGLQTLSIVALYKRKKLGFWSQIGLGIFLALSLYFLVVILRFIIY